MSDAMRPALTPPSVSNNSNWIRTLRFANFKCLETFSITLKQLNVLVGPNNAGKSTVLDGLRALSGAVRYAATRNPSLLEGPGGRLAWGHAVPETAIPINLANLRSNYADAEVSIEAVLYNERKLILTFEFEGRIVLSLDEKHPTRTATEFRRNYPYPIASIPTLGPLEEEEAYLSDDYVARWRDTRRSHRLFRNIWYRQTKEEFSAFQSLVEETWPGMSILPPEVLRGERRLVMFAKERRLDREIAWAGFGFQIWLQFLTHFMLGAQAPILIIDEPDIYLHPDLQHRLISLIRMSEKQVCLATHSVEVINEAEHDEVVLIDKERKQARRVTDVAGLQHALFSIGSAQNIHLARLSRQKKLLFFEGQDFKIVRKVAEKLGLPNLASSVNITVVPVGGFSQARRVENTAWIFETVLESEIDIAAVFDRDYRCNEEVDAFLEKMRHVAPLTFVLERKELENYLLEPHALVRAIRARLPDSNDQARISEKLVEEMLDEVFSELKAEVVSQLAAHRSRYSTGGSKDPSTVLSLAIREIERNWKTPGWRRQVVGGKAALSALNQRLGELFKISLTPAGIVRAYDRASIPRDLADICIALDKFAQARPSGAPVGRTVSAFQKARR
jgi:ABC-type multidrug transport system ATPase subunit